jgi:hypothetical protein
MEKVAFYEPVCYNVGESFQAWSDCSVPALFRHEKIFKNHCDFFRKNGTNK